MNALYLQIIVGAGVMIGIIIAFILTIKSGQYDDLDSPAYRILMDDDDPRIPGKTSANSLVNEKQAEKKTKAN